MEKSIIIFAEAAAEAAPQAGTSNSLWIGMLLMVVAMWFLIIAPQRKRQKEMQKMMETLQEGDKVITISGVYGTIVDKTEKSFILKIADGVRIEILKSAIQGKVTEDAPSGK